MSPEITAYLVNMINGGESALPDLTKSLAQFSFGDGPDSTEPVCIFIFL
jgi:hypothetical protein